MVWLCWGLHWFSAAQHQYPLAPSSPWVVIVIVTDICDITWRDMMLRLIAHSDEDGHVMYPFSLSFSLSFQFRSQFLFHLILMPLERLEMGDAFQILNSNPFLFLYFILSWRSLTVLLFTSLLNDSLPFSSHSSSSSSSYAPLYFISLLRSFVWSNPCSPHSSHCFALLFFPCCYPALLLSLFIISSSPSCDHFLFLPCCFSVRLSVIISVSSLLTIFSSKHPSCCL